MKTGTQTHNPQIIFQRHQQSEGTGLVSKRLKVHLALFTISLQNVELKYQHKPALKFLLERDVKQANRAQRDR